MNPLSRHPELFYLLHSTSALTSTETWRLALCLVNSLERYNISLLSIDEKMGAFGAFLHHSFPLEERPINLASFLWHFLWLGRKETSTFGEISWPFFPFTYSNWFPKGLVLFPGPLTSSHLLQVLIKL